MLVHGSARITPDQYLHLFDEGPETAADQMDARSGAAQLRTKPESGDVLDLARRRKKSI